MLKIQQLRYVLAVHDLGGFSAAANALARTQPALSLGIRELERTLGEPIFEKQASGVLTPFGEKCLPRFRELVGVHDRVSRDIADIVNKRSGRLEVAVAPSIARRFMPSVLGDFLRAFPNIDIVLHDGTAETIATQVLEGTVEFGVSAMWQQQPELAFRPLLTDEVGVVCHVTHPLADSNALRWTDLLGHQMVCNGTSRLLETTQAAPLLQNSRFYVSEMTSIVALLETGLVYTTLPQLAMLDDHASLRFIPLVEPKIVREMGVITRRGASLSPAGRELVALLSGITQ